MCKDNHLFVGGRIERIRDLKRIYPKSTFLSAADVNSRGKISSGHIFVFWQWCDHRTMGKIRAIAPKDANIHYIRGTNLNHIMYQVNEALS